VGATHAFNKHFTLDLSDEAERRSDSAGRRYYPRITDALSHVISVSHDFNKHLTGDLYVMRQNDGCTRPRHISGGPSCLDLSSAGKLVAESGLQNPQDGLVVAHIEYNQLFRFEEMRCRKPRGFARPDGHAIRTNPLRFTIRLRGLRVLKHLNTLSVDIQNSGSDGKKVWETFSLVSSTVAPLARRFLIRLESSFADRAFEPG